MKEYIITIVGGASSYTPGIVRSLMNRREKLPLKKLVLQDVDSKEGTSPSSLGMRGMMLR